MPPETSRNRHHMRDLRDSKKHRRAFELSCERGNNSEIKPALQSRCIPEGIAARQGLLVGDGLEACGFMASTGWYLKGSTQGP